MLLFFILIFLILNVILPQERVLGKDVLKKITEKNKIYAFFLEKLNFKDIPTNKLFLFLIFLFYLQLILFIIRYFSLTLKRYKNKNPSFENWSNLKIEKGIEGILLFLKKEGYKEYKKKDSLYFALNEISPFGFLFFHFSFLFFLLGAILLNITRYEAEAFLGLEQEISLKDKNWVYIKRMPKGKVENINIFLSEVDIKTEKGQPIFFEIFLILKENKFEFKGKSKVNKPLKYKRFSFYPLYKDDAFIIQIQEKDGFIVENSAVFSQCGRNKNTSFVLKKEINGEIICNDEPYLFFPMENLKIPLIQGNKFNLKNYNFKIIGKIPWVKIKIVKEKGGFFIILGFIFSILGLSFRFLFPLRQIVIRKDTLYFKADYFPLSFREKIKNIFEVQNGNN